MSDCDYSTEDGHNASVSRHGRHTDEPGTPTPGLFRRDGVTVSTVAGPNSTLAVCVPVCTLGGRAERVTTWAECKANAARFAGSKGLALAAGELLRTRPEDRTSEEYALAAALHACGGPFEN